MEKNRDQSKETKKEPSSISIPQISTPKGGGAIRGIGEKFSTNQFTGTCSLTVPIFATPSRSDFYPKLSLSYDSAGSGNGSFGIGWNISIPSISRKTEKGIPKYRDEENSDTFILSGAEDLVPSLVRDGNKWKKVTQEKGDYLVQQYRPRIEGLFAKIEKWQHKSGETYWRSISKDNVTSIYGKDLKCRIFDPDNPSHIFKWLLEESYDDKGNIISYEYKEENSENIDFSLPHEKNRLEKSQFANKYLKKIKYGNKKPDDRTDWSFEVVFDYGEFEIKDIGQDKIQLNNVNKWDARLDAFSNYRSGFEIRSYRICRHIFMFHNFAELGNAPCLVRSTDFEYDETSRASFLKSITQRGYIRKGTTNEYQTKSFPPLEFEYTVPTIDNQLRFVDDESLTNLPIGLDGTQFKWIDLYSEGISGILTEQENAWFYKRNSGNARFAPMQIIAQKPSSANLDGGRQEITYLTGDGTKFLVQYSDHPKGFYELDNGHWGPFTPFSSLPNLNWNDPNLKFIDLDGDGNADILISEDILFRWYPFKAKEGFGSSNLVYKQHDEEKGPKLVFADSTQSIYLADMSSDGLTDIVRIRNGEVCYWPNLGYGRFGSKITMNHAPFFDNPDQFNQSRIKLADIDGSGTTDIIYLGRNGVKFWFNQSGNSWSHEHTLANFAPIDNLSSVMVIDLLGNGTSCIVWSSPLPEKTHRMQYVDLMSGTKPHLLKSIKNNMGSETRIRYAPSTRFYLEDLAQGKPWITKLHFPVHVVEYVETFDYLTKTRLVSHSKYHHGYYDRNDKEFRGFGLVEHWDTESFEQFQNSQLFEQGHELVEEGLHAPPVYTKSWFHTGAYHEEKIISKQFETEYYDQDLQAILLPDTIIPDYLEGNEIDEACRALKGLALRQEVYAVDGSQKKRHPFTVSEKTYKIKRIQPLKDNQYAVFYTHESEIIDFHYERNPKDPRIQQKFVLQVDEFGNVQKEVTVHYPRRAQSGITIYDEQSKLKATITQKNYAKILGDNTWITGVVTESHLYELGGLDQSGQAHFDFEYVDDAVNAALLNIINFGDDFTSGYKARRLSWERSYYYDPSQKNILSFGTIKAPILLCYKENAVFPIAYANRIYGSKITDTILTDEGKYHKANQYWWEKSNQQYYFDSDKFCQVWAVVDPTGQFDPKTPAQGTYYEYEYDKYLLTVKKLTDPLKTFTDSIINYRTVTPTEVIDPNKIHSKVIYDHFGMVITSTIFSNNTGTSKGDGNLDAFVMPQNPALDDIISHPENFIQDATAFFHYDYSAWIKPSPQDRTPCYSVAVQREMHKSEQGTASPRFQLNILYADGLGRELQKKLLVESGLAFVKQPDGSYLEEESTTRWLASGRTVYNNKGKPIKQYEPFYSATHEYESEKSLVEFGVTPVIHYDPLERVIRTDTPKGFFSSVNFDAWRQEHWDENDNVAKAVFPSGWSTQRLDKETKSLENAKAHHADTPKITHLNNLGQIFLEENSVDGNDLFTHYELDIGGNKISITDPRQYQKNKSRTPSNRIKTFEFSYDMQNNQISSISSDAGTKQTLKNAADNPIYSRTARGFEISTKYDKLLRPTEIRLKGNGLDNLVEKLEYGTPSGVSEQNHLVNKLIKHYDQSGVKEFQRYNIDGNNENLKVNLRDEYKNEVNWDHTEALLEDHESKATFDALGRLIVRTQSDKSIHTYTYHQSGLLKSVEVTLKGESPREFVKGIQYNAKGQRTEIQYGNGTVTNYEYEKETFRLESLKTTRSSDSKILQKISYAYDPVGNIIKIEDESHKTIFTKQNKVEPILKYEYDSLYRLKSASGRQHPAVLPDDYKNPNSVKQSRYLSFDSVSVNDPTALENYAQEYYYDFAGNLETILHTVPNTSRWWTKILKYSDDSSRLSSTELGSTTHNYSFDAAGNMIKLEHIPEITWNYRDNMSSAVLMKQTGGDDDVEYYVYDSSGQRTRKIKEHYDIVGTNKFLNVEEKFYLDGYEIKKIKRIDLQTNTETEKFERISTHVMDDKKRIAITHKWIKDENAKETDDVSKIKYHYQLGNHLGSCVLELNESEEVISYEEYYPYGETAFIAGSSHGSVSKEVSFKEYRYSGKECDDSTGLYYFGARYYAPWLGRWISCDPAGMTDGLNLYRYVQNNPLTLVDPDGKIPLLAIALLVAVLLTPQIANAPGPRDPTYNKSTPELALDVASNATIISGVAKIPAAIGGVASIITKEGVKRGGTQLVKELVKEEVKDRGKEAVANIIDPSGTLAKVSGVSQGLKPTPKAAFSTKPGEKLIKVIPTRVKGDYLSKYDNTVGGNVVPQKFLNNTDTAEMERRLGFHKGDLAEGATILEPLEPPSKVIPEGYSNVPSQAGYPSGTGVPQFRITKEYAPEVGKVIDVPPGVTYDRNFNNK